MIITSHKVGLLQFSPEATLQLNHLFKSAGLKQRLESFPNNEEFKIRITGSKTVSLPGVLLINIDPSRDDGWDLFQFLYSRGLYEQMIIAAVSPVLPVPLIDKAYHLGARAVLSQPIDLVELSELVKRADRWTRRCCTEDRFSMN